ncbi:MAG: ABC transporter ATP-binding protein [Proteobacteria bacterium]|nr:MAG: ABC transporter ATP-binding protein [Pseudomonadota bacterium]
MSLDHYIEKEDFHSKRPSFRVLTLLLRDLFRQKFNFFIGIGFVILSTLSSLYEPTLFGRVIDEGLAHRNTSIIQKLGYLYLGLLVARATSLIFQSYFFEKLAQEMMQRLRLKLFGHLQRLRLETFDRTPVGRLVTRLTNDTSAMNEMFSAGFVTLLGNFLLIMGTLVWIFILNPKLALVSVLSFPVLVFFSIKFSRTLITAYREARMRLSSMNAFLAENILGMKTVQMFRREKRQIARFRETNDQYMLDQFASVQVYSYFQPLITWCSGIGVATVLAYGGNASLKGELSTGELVAFTSYLLSLFQPIREFVDRWTIFLSGMSSAERIYGLLEWETEKGHVGTSHPTIQAVRGEIEFDRVSFAYNGVDFVIKDLSFKIKAGEKIGFVGHTGAGKSTVISLLLRFYQPTQGRILLDGVDIQTIPLKDLRRVFGLVQQDVFTFSGTLAENISLWERDSTSNRYERLSQSLGLKSRPSLALDERGSNLSAGERQMLSYLRVAEREPKVWLLDEPTSQIDSETEAKLLEQLFDESKSKTFLMIAHRLSTVKKMDRIIVMNRGEIAEQGTHEELIALRGIYYRLEAVDREQRVKMETSGL